MLARLFCAFTIVAVSGFSACAQTLWKQRGDTFYADSAIQFASQVTYVNTNPIRQTLKAWVPDGAISYRVRAALVRCVRDTNGNCDVSMVAFLPGYQGGGTQYNYVFDSFGGGAMSW